MKPLMTEHVTMFAMHSTDAAKWLDHATWMFRSGQYKKARNMVESAQEGVDSLRAMLSHFSEDPPPTPVEPRRE